MAFRWRTGGGPTLNACLQSLRFYRGSGPILLRNPIFFLFFRGGGPDPLPPPPPLDPHMKLHCVLPSYVAGPCTCEVFIYWDLCHCHTIFNLSGLSSCSWAQWGTVKSLWLFKCLRHAKCWIEIKISSYGMWVHCCLLRHCIFDFYCLLYNVGTSLVPYGRAKNWQKVA